VTTRGDHAPDEARRTSFGSRASLYDAIRPSYPQALVDAVIARTAPRRLLEIGAGTGKATCLFARTNLPIVALEPTAEMAAILRLHAAPYPNVVVEQTRFEAYTGEADFDLVYAAQSFHWVEPEARYVTSARLLRPTGALVVIRNEKAAIDPDVRFDFDAAYERWSPGEPVAADQVEAACARWIAELSATAWFEPPPEVLRFPWTASYTTREYVDLVDTYSDTITMAGDRRRGLLDALAEAIERHGGRLEVPYVSLAFVSFRCRP